MDGGRKILPDDINEHSAVGQLDLMAAVNRTIPCVCVWERLQLLTPGTRFPTSGSRRTAVYVRNCATIQSFTMTYARLFVISI